MSRFVALGCTSILLLASVPFGTQAVEADPAYASCAGLRSTQRLLCKQQISLQRNEARRRENIARKALPKRPVVGSSVPSRKKQERAQRASSTGRKMSARSLRSEVSAQQQRGKRARR